MNSLFQC
jgi:hypothetical protein